MFMALVLGMGSLELDDFRQRQRPWLSSTPTCTVEASLPGSLCLPSCLASLTRVPIKRASHDLTAKPLNEPGRAKTAILSTRLRSHRRATTIQKGNYPQGQCCASPFPQPFPALFPCMTRQTPPVISHCSRLWMLDASASASASRCRLATSFWGAISA